MSELDTSPHLQPGLTWQEWKLRWTAATSRPEAKGLLNSIFDASVGNLHYTTAFQRQEQEDEKVIFLLDLADGYNSYRRDVLTEVREKAFVVLADGYLKHINLHSLSSAVFNKLVWFLMDESSNDEDYNRGSNIPPNNPANDAAKIKYAVDILRKYQRAFCQRFWGDDESKRLIVLEIMGYVDSHDQFMALLPSVSGGRLSYPWSNFSEAIMERLRELALFKSESIDAAILKGSNAANLYIIVSAALREINRVKEIKRLEDEAADAAHRLQEARAATV